MGSNGEEMASIEVDGRRVALTPDGLGSISGSREEARKKVADAIEREFSE